MSVFSSAKDDPFKGKDPFGGGASVTDDPFKNDDPFKGSSDDPFKESGVDPFSGSGGADPFKQSIFS